MDIENTIIQNKIIKLEEKRTKMEIIKRITKMPSKFPEYESDYYDAGYLQAKKDIIKEINKLGVV